ncbi:MAG: TRAP transporter substrate-binding protein [bacterium]
MKRRDFIKTSSAVTALGGAALLSGCQDDNKNCTPSSEQGASAAPKQQTQHWKMVTAWPLNFPVLGTGANYLAKLINEMSGGRIQVKVYGAGELVPAFEVFDAVSSGTAQMGHGAAYYWKGKIPEAQFFGAVPFGMIAEEMNAWLYYGGGLELWQQSYERFKLVPFPVGSTGVQMGGWFNKEINSINDLKGLKMRIPGLGGEVLRRAGGTPVNTPGAELFTALQTGVLDATEWVGPYNDRAFGLYQAAKYYYHPGWHEPNATLEGIINKDVWDSLDEDLQAIVRTACRAANEAMLSEFEARNPAALTSLVEENGVQLRRFPDDVLATLKQYSYEVVSELAGLNESAKKIHASYDAFLQQARAWQKISMQSYLMERER